MEVRDHLPLQQGLRHGVIERTKARLFVRDHLPLQQGLKLYRYLGILLVVSCF